MSSTSIRQDKATQRTDMSLSGPQKTAILILCLGEERGSEFLKQFDEADIREITQAMAALGPIHAETAERVIAEFAAALGAEDNSPANAAKNMLKSFMSEDDVDRIMEDNGGPVHDGGVWKELAAIDDKVIVEYLQEEQDQIIAIVMAHLPPEVAARVLPMLGEGRMLGIVERMVGLDEVPDHLIAQIEESLRADILVASQDEGNSAAEIRMADVFNKLDDKLFERISEHLGEKQPELFGAIKNRMFTFNDLVRIEAQDLAKVMRGVQGNTVPLALKGAKEEVRDHFLGSLPARSKDMLLDEMKNMGAVKARDVRDAQAALVDCAKQMLQQEVISLIPEEGEEVEAEEMID